MGQYTFGEGDAAALRLALLADVFEPTTRALLASAVGRRSGVVADLGCGPGHTTRLIHDTCRPGSTLGLDSSQRFVDLARRLTNGAGVRFAVHDAASLPLPGSPYDALYARLLLAHLPEPLDLAQRWCTEIGPGGVVVLEETEIIDAPPGVLRDYEELTLALVQAEGGSLCAGPLLAPLGGSCIRVPVEAAVAARIYGLNLATWGDDAVRRGLADRGDVDRLAAGLATVRDGSVAWVVRQLVLS